MLANVVEQLDVLLAVMLARLVCLDDEHADRLALDAQRHTDPVLARDAEQSDLAGRLKVFMTLERDLLR